MDIPSLSMHMAQSNLLRIKAIARVELFVADIDGKLVASTKTTGNSFENSVLEFVDTVLDETVLDRPRILVDIAVCLIVRDLLDDDHIVHLNTNRGEI